jgi:hypothetical protein
MRTPRPPLGGESIVLWDPRILSWGAVRDALGSH